jgi:hypothetical protein
MVWQDRARNEWAVSIGNALAADQALPPRPTDAMDAFSLGDPAAVTTILDAAGFIGCSFTDVHDPVYYGRDVVTALEWVRSFTTVTETLQPLDPASRKQALDRLIRTLDAHTRADGVWFDSRAWIVIARRA